MTKTTYVWTVQGVVEKPATVAEFTLLEEGIENAAWETIRAYEEAIVRAMLGIVPPIPREPVTFEWRGTAERALKFDAPAISPSGFVRPDAT